MRSVPHAPPDFVGRRLELSELERLFSVYPCVWLCGLPGFGKTTLSLKLMEGRSPSCFVLAEPGATAQSVARAICGQLGGDALRSAVGAENAVDAAVTAIESSEALVVLDDAHEVERAEELVAACAERLVRGRLLVVSRERVPARRALAAVPELQLFGLDAEDLSQLAKHVGARLSAGAAEEAVSSTGGSPLLLRQRLRSVRPGERDPLHAAISLLEPRLQLALALLAVAPKPGGASELAEAGVTASDIDALARRLLVDARGQGVAVHALVRAAVSAVAPAAAAEATQRWSELCHRRGWVTAEWLLAARAKDLEGLKALLPDAPVLRPIGQATDLLEAVNAVKALAGPLPRLKLLEAELLLQLDRHDAADAVLPAVPDAGDEAFHALLCAEIALRRGDLALAQARLKNADRSSCRTAQVEAGVLQRRGELQHAVELLLFGQCGCGELERALIDVQAALPLALLGRVSEALERLDGAVRVLTAAKDTPSIAWALSTRARLERQTGNWAGSAATARRALDLFPPAVPASTRTPLEIQLAVTQAVLGAVGEAQPVLARMAESPLLGAHAESVINCLALCHADLGELDEAKRVVHRARRLNTATIGLVALADGIVAACGDDRLQAAAQFEACANDRTPHVAAIARSWQSRLAFEDGGVPAACEKPATLTAARAAFLDGEAPRAAALAEEAQQRWTATGQHRGVLEALELRVACALEAGDLELALGLCEERAQAASACGQHFEAEYSRALACAAQVRRWPPRKPATFAGPLGEALAAFVRRPWDPQVSSGAASALVRRLRAGVGLSRRGAMVVQRGSVRIVADPDREDHALVLDARDHSLWAKGNLAARPQQWGLLEQLAIAGGQPVDREALFSEVWQQRFTSASHDAAVKVAVARLRRLLERRLPAGAVEAVGSAYRFAPWLDVALVVPAAAACNPR
jgi:tetratricopeptide (TPR) repeat protein